MNRWQIVVALGLVCVSVVLGAPRFGRRHGPPGVPPEFEKYLPKETLDKLRSIHEDHSLRWEEKIKMINEIFDSVPQEILEKLPPPPGFERLPQDIKDKLKEIHSDGSLKWSQKMEKAKAIIEALPEEQKRFLPPPFGRRGPGPFGPGHFRGFPPMPPPGFKDVLPEDIYNELVSIHQNKDLSDSEKKNKIDEVMSKVSKEILAKLPLPPNFDKLPQEVQEQARKILHDFSVGFDERHKKFFEFIESLPEEQRRLVAFPFGRGPGPFRPGHFRGLPPMPPPNFKNVIPDDIYNELVSIHQDKDLSELEKKTKIDQAMSKVPKEILAKLPLPPNFDKLPQEVQEKAREIINDFSVGFDERHKKLFELIESLPEDQKMLVRPPFLPMPFGRGWGKRGGFVFPPSEFKEILPADVYSKLEEINQNKDLSWTERWSQIDEVMKKLPKETLEKLPLPPHLRGLPEDVQVQIKAIMRNYELSHWERKQQVRNLIDGLPEDIKKLVPPRPFGPFGPRGKMFPMGPPPDFKEYLPADVWEKLNAIHANKNLSRHERMKQIDQLMNTLPTDTLLKLPLPPHLRRLPKEAQDKLHKIFADKTKSFEEKMRASKEFVKSLPKEQRKLARPYPPGFEKLPDEYKQKIEAVFDNDDLHCHERFEQIREIMESLPKEIRNKMPPPPFDE